MIFPIIFCPLLMTSNTWVFTTSWSNQFILGQPEALTMFVCAWGWNQLLAASGPMDLVLPMRTTTKTLAVFGVWYLKTWLCLRLNSSGSEPFRCSMWHGQGSVSAPGYTVVHHRSSQRMESDWDSSSGLSRAPCQPVSCILPHCFWVGGDEEWGEEI